jgi:hypothetical protein
VSAWRTALAGMLGLALLEAAVSSQQAAGRAGSLLTGVAKVVDHVLSPTVPAIPDLRTRAGGGSDDTGRIGVVPGQGVGGALGGSLLPPSWTTSPTAPPSSPPSQLYV